MHLRRSLVSGLLLALGLVGHPAAADDGQRTPVDVHADHWLAEKRGARSDSERAAEQLTKGALDRLMGEPPTPEEKEIARLVQRQVSQWRDARGNPCTAAAVDLAHSLGLVLDRRDIMRGAADMLQGALGGAAGGAGAAEELTRFFGRELGVKLLEGLREKTFERFQGDARDFFRKGTPEVDAESDTRGECRTFYRMVWNKARETYDVLIAGDCACKGPCGPVRLSRWTIKGSGTIVPRLVYSETQGISVRFEIGPPTLAVTAACCGAQDRETFVFLPDNAEVDAGDRWVGVLRPGAPRTPAAAPPPRTPRTATQGGGRRAPPAIKIPDIPSGPLTVDAAADLADAATGAYERAQARYEDAFRRYSAAAEGDKAALLTEVAEAEAVRNAARRAVDSANAKLREANGAQQNQQQEIAPGGTSLRTGETRDQWRLRMLERQRLYGFVPPPAPTPSVQVPAIVGQVIGEALRSEDRPRGEVRDEPRRDSPREPYFN